MNGHIEDILIGGRPMTDKELAEHYKKLYSEVKKQKDDVVEYIKYNATSNYFDKDKNMFRREIDILRMLGEIDE